MARVFITGSTDGLGRAAAQALIDEGHHVVPDARSPARAAAVDELASRAAGVVIGELSGFADTGSVADQVNAIGRIDAVIPNGGTYSSSRRAAIREGQATILAADTLAPCILTALIERTATGHHRRPQVPAAEAADARFHDELADTLAELTGVSLFREP